MKLLQNDQQVIESSFDEKEGKKEVYCWSNNTILFRRCRTIARQLYFYSVLAELL